MTMWKLVRVWIVGSCWDLKFCQFCVRYVVCVNDKILRFVIRIRDLFLLLNRVCILFGDIDGQSFLELMICEFL